MFWRHTVDSTPKDIFDRAALSAIKRWKYKVKIIRGVPSEQHADLLFEFKLKRPKPTSP